MSSSKAQGSQTTQEPGLLFDSQDGIGVLTLNRPKVHNAIDAQTMALWESYLDQIEEDSSLRVVILTGSGEISFCSGGDLRYFDSLKGRAAGQAMSLRMQSILERLHGGSRPVIAAINGDAYGGGCEILTACHLRVASQSARFAFRQALNGVITGWGGGVRLLRLIDRGAALRLLLTSERISAEAAHTIGLVDQVVSPESVLSTCMALARQIVENSSFSIASFLNLARTLDQKGESAARALETELFADSWVGPDFERTLARFRR